MSKTVVAISPAVTFEVVFVEVASEPSLEDVFAGASGSGWRAACRVPCVVSTGSFGLTASPQLYVAVVRVDGPTIWLYCLFPTFAAFSAATVDRGVASGQASSFSRSMTSCEFGVVPMLADDLSEFSRGRPPFMVLRLNFAFLFLSALISFRRKEHDRKFDGCASSQFLHLGGPFAWVGSSQSFAACP